MQMTSKTVSRANRICRIIVLLYLIILEKNIEQEAQEEIMATHSVPRIYVVRGKACWRCVRMEKQASVIKVKSETLEN